MSGVHRPGEPESPESRSRGQAAEPRRAVSRAHPGHRQAGINTHVAYIIEFPFDTPASVGQDIRRLTDELGPEQASFFMLTPLPGSRDHQELVQRGASLDHDLNRYDSFQVTTTHPRMSREEWTRAYQEAWASFYSADNMKRIPQRFWRTCAHTLKRGRLDRLDVTGLAFNSLQELTLFTTFAAVFFSRLLRRLLARTGFDSGVA